MRASLETASVAAVQPFSSYPGSKGGAGVWQRIISQMPPHERYFELFLGNSPIFLKKLPSTIAFGIDADRQVVEAWQGLTLPAGVTVTCGDAISTLRSWRFRPGDLIYLDPPYVVSSRIRPRRLYRCELRDVHHRRLLRAAIALECYVMISGYRGPLYDQTLADWRRVDIPTVNRGGHRTIESVWCNFEEPRCLHDFRWMGENFRQREKFNRRVDRLSRKLARLPGIERAAVLARIGVAAGKLETGRTRLLGR